MPLYEHVFLARQDISTQQVEGLVQEYRNIIEGSGGTIGKTEYWGLKASPSASKRIARRISR